MMRGEAKSTIMPRSWFCWIDSGSTHLLLTGYGLNLHLTEGPIYDTNAVHVGLMTATRDAVFFER